MDVGEAIGLLGHFDQALRERAMEVLRAKGASAVPLLLAALDHPSPAVRGNAALVLGQLGAEEALGPLAYKVAELPPGDDRTLCVRALADLAGPHRRDDTSLLELFARLAQDPDLFVRALSCAALGKLGHPRAVPILARAQGDPEPWVREAASKAVEELARARQSGKVPDKKTEAVASPDEIAAGETAPPAPATARLGASSAVPPAPIRAAVLSPPSGETAGPPANIPRLIDDLFSSDAVRRDLAAEDLVAMGEPAVHPLCQAVRSPVRDPPLQALVVLGRLGHRAALGPLLSVAANPGTAVELRTVAIRAIGQICDGSERAVLDLLLAEPASDPLLRAAVVSALGAFRSVRSVRALLGHLDDREEFVRECAAEALARAASPGVPDLLAALASALRREADERVRERLLAALDAAVRVTGPEEAAQRGAELLGAEDGVAKLAGLRLLAAAGRRHPDAARVAVAALREGERSVRLFACEVIGEVAPPGYEPAVEALSRLTGDRERDVSRAAILALGAVGGPRAAATLRQLRSDADPDVADAARAALERMPPHAAEVIPLRPDR